MSHEEPKHPLYLLWADIETTGLDPNEDMILEIAWRLTRFEYPYEFVEHEDAARSFIVNSAYPSAYLPLMDDTVRAMHEQSGLLDAIRAEAETIGPTFTTSLIEEHLLVLSQDWPTDKDTKVMLAGNSIHFDLSFLRVHMPTFAKRLSYRTFDASTFYRGCLSAGMPPLPKHEEAHRAMADVERSIELMRECVRWCRCAVPRDAPDKKVLRYGAGGALLAEDDCDGLAERLEGDSARSYGAPYILAESMSRRTAEVIARAFGRVLLVET